MEEAGDSAFSLYFCNDCQGVWITATMMGILEKRYEKVKRDTLSSKGASPARLALEGTWMYTQLPPMQTNDGAHALSKDFNRGCV